MVPVSDTNDEAERKAIEAAHLRKIRDRDNGRYQKLRRDAEAVQRACEAWPQVRTGEEWARTVEEAERDYRSGKFLIERLGAERFLDPGLMATLLGIRQAMLADLDQPTMAEYLLIDSVVISYFNLLRTQSWLGNLSLDLERAFFRQSPLPARLSEQDGPDVPIAEERLKKISGELVPLVDRAQRAMVRGLAALREVRRGPVPSVAIGRAAQVNLAPRQENTVIR